MLPGMGWNWNEMGPNGVGSGETGMRRRDPGLILEEAGVAASSAEGHLPAGIFVIGKGAGLPTAGIEAGAGITTGAPTTGAQPPVGQASAWQAGSWGLQTTSHLSSL